MKESIIQRSINNWTKVLDRFAQVKSITLFSILSILSGCQETPKLHQNLSFWDLFSSSLQKENYFRVWWLENISFHSNGEMKIQFPQGSYKPSWEIIWGAWFIKLLPDSSDRIRLSYKVMFPEQFDFVKGGKLPWLCWGTCPTWWSDAEEWFSVRFMWRKWGKVELYTYSPDKNTQYGESHSESMFEFIPWKYYTVSMEVILNQIGMKNGEIAYFIDTNELFRQKWLFFRTNQDITIDKFLFSSFFWGSDSSWATPKNTEIFFKDFKVEPFE